MRSRWKPFSSVPEKLASDAWRGQVLERSFTPEAWYCRQHTRTSRARWWLPGRRGRRSESASLHLELWVKRPLPRHRIGGLLSPRLFLRLHGLGQGLIKRPGDCLRQELRVFAEAVFFFLAFAVLGEGAELGVVLEQALFSLLDLAAS